MRPRRRRSLLTMALLGWLLRLASPGCPAAEPLGVSLLRPDSLAGWTYGPDPPVGWSIAKGRLAGTAEAVPLLSGFTFGQFELSFQWSVSEGAAWKVRLPDVPSGQGIEIVLCEEAGCGRLHDGPKLLAAGQAVPPIQGRAHTAVIRRDGDRLSLAVDGQGLGEVAIARDRRFGLGLAVGGSRASLENLRLIEPPGEPLFNGKDLDGWWTPGKLTAWGAENGELVLRKGGGDYLRTKKQFANFTLSLEYIIQKGGNSGIGIRTPPKGWPSGDGMELQIWDVPYGRPLDKHAAMAIYGNVPPLARADRSGQWNRVVIKADGRMITAWVNGQLVQQSHTAEHPELRHRHLRGWIGIQDHGGKMQVRNLSVLEAPDGLGLDAWRTPRRPSGACALLDRLMNPQGLSLPDEIESRAVTATVSGSRPEGHVLADLPGPGALVRIARTSDEGRLAFFFDGQPAPSLECRPAELPQVLPHACDDVSPLLTCVTYRKGLRIVLHGAGRGEYRLDYVTLPGRYAVETFRPGEPAIPRDWLPALVYRHDQYGWGVHREHDPRPRAESAQKTIGPGKSETLVELDGAGIVHWVKLRADKRVLESQDLWLEVRVDGQGTPALAAPARLLFAGLAGQGNWPNFVLVDRGGATSMLAMPFGKGLSIAAANRGKRPTPAVGLSVSHEPATAATRDDVLHRMRLRGIFQPAGEPTRELVRLAGPGRWIGLVCDQPKGTPPAIDSLVVDGRPAEGWTSPGLGLFLGRDGDFRSSLSGRHRGLWWRYLLMEPVDFRQSLVLKTAAPESFDRLALYYTAQ